MTQKIDLKKREIAKIDVWGAVENEMLVELCDPTWLLPVFPWLVFKDASISANLMRQLQPIILRL